MPYIYGDSFGNLQANVTADAALRQRGLESALAGAVGALGRMRDRSIQQDQFNRQLLERQNEQEAEFPARQAALEAATAEANARKKYYDWLQTQDNSTKTRDRELDERFLMDTGKQGLILDDEEAKRLAPNASDTVRNIAVQQSKGVQSTQEAAFNRAQALAGALNNETALRQKIKQAQQTNAQAPGGFKRFFGATDTRVPQEQIDALQAQADALARSIQPYRDEKGMLDRFVQPSLNEPGKYEPAVPVPYHLQRKKAPTTSTGTDANAILPATTVPFRRTYGLRPGQQAVQPEAPAATPPTTTATLAATPPDDRRMWVLTRAKELVGMGQDTATAVARARKEYQALFQ